LRHERLSDWLSWLETLHPSEIDLGLDRVGSAAAAAGLDAPGFPLITVAGTNGKGSVCALLEACLAAAGQRVGCYTSPHLLRFNERIRVDRREVDDDEIAAALAHVDAHRGDTSLSYFEFTTLAAMRIFQRRRVDVAVLEVGLGGRLDAVNIWDAEVAVVTAVAVDHIDWLGDDREAIGAEKAGICRRDRPLVCADPEPPASIAASAAARGARLLRLGVDFAAEAVGPAAAGEDALGESAGSGDERGAWRFCGSREQLDDLPPPALPGDWQYANAATACEALSQLQAATPLRIPREAIAAGLRELRLPGRFECHRRDGVEVIFDVAHNPHAVSALAAALRAEAPLASGDASRRGRCHAVAGFMADKAVAEVLGQLLGETGDGGEALTIDAWYLGELPAARAMPASRLAKLVAAAAPRAALSCHGDVAAALAAALAAAAPGDRLLVFGSFVTVGLARAAFFAAGQSDDGGGQEVAG